MDSRGFLNDLILKLEDENTEVINIAFAENDNYFLKLLSSFDSLKKIIFISSQYFQDKFEIITSIDSRNFLEAVISLPVYNDENNVMVLIYNPSKNGSKFIFIDESDSLIHKDDGSDWAFAYDELVNRIINTYNEFYESETSVIMDLDNISPQKNRNAKIRMELENLKKYTEDTAPRKKRVISDELADGLLDNKEKLSIRDEMTKHDIRTAETNLQNDSFFSLDDAFYYKKRQNPENLLYKNNKRLIKDNVQFRKLGKIADLHNIYAKNDENSILISTCKTCSSQIVYYNNDVSDFNGEVFIEVINISEDVSVEYLYEYLRSSNGLDELLYFSKGNAYIRPENIKNAKIPIPPLDIQKEIVSVARESREFFKTVELLKKDFDSNILDYKHMQNSIRELKGDISFDSKSNVVTSLSRSWRHAYKGLIWPLAISYLSATKGGFESVEKKDNYLILFEFIAAFNSIILLSGLPDDVYRSNFSKIWNSKKGLNEYKQMTFANWVYLSKNLSYVYKNNNFTSQLDENLFEKISDEKILNILEKAKDLRNDEAHGTHSNAFEAEKIIEKLDVYLDDVFDILDAYSDYKLIYVTGNTLAHKQNFKHQVILLNGPCAQPIYDEIIFDSYLYGDCLYLYNPKNNKKLLISDKFMKFAPVEVNKKRWALFIYYKCDYKEYNAYYKCFQSKEKDLKENISSFKRDILEK